MTCWENAEQRGTLYRALKAIADQVSTKVIVVRVAEHKEEDGKTQDQLVIGGSEDDGSYTGMYALLVAEQDESIGYRPRILAAPELDTGGGDKIPVRDCG
ncbi:Major tail sheath protein FI [Escherichia coli]|uniref:Major tail sheath protein FI n=1 Tax=Escherichia coli TaxID=562 RepID=A0A2X3JT76_ECOLX|nr:Major tail sheath protein FI [Escherichia coli]